MIKSMLAVLPSLLLVPLLIISNALFPQVDRHYYLDSDPQSNKPLPAASLPIFPTPGTYDLGLTSDGTHRVRFNFAGAWAGDTLAPCHMLRVGLSEGYAHQICYEPVNGQVQAPTGDTTNEGEIEYRPIDPAQIAAQAVNYQTPAGMQVNVQPNKGWVFATVPTIVYMTGDKPSYSMNIDGLDVEVTWNVREHQIEFNEPGGSGSKLVALTDGAPYPNESLTWTYRNEGKAHVLVTTVWDAKVTIAGSSFDLPKQHTTTSSSSEFEIRKPIISLTKPKY